MKFVLICLNSYFPFSQYSTEEVEYNNEIYQDAFYLNFTISFSNLALKTYKSFKSLHM